MASQRPSFAKRDREMKLKDKAKAKAERRAQRRATPRINKGPPIEGDEVENGDNGSAEAPAPAPSPAPASAPLTTPLAPMTPNRPR
jgi:hypothetical protein